MYFLNGDRIYIKPQRGVHAIHAQLLDCLEQVRQMELQNGHNLKVFKLNFFVDTASGKVYKDLVKTITTLVSEKLHPKIILNFIAQPPLTCRIIVEAFFYNPELWETLFIKHENNPVICFKNSKAKILIGNVQSDLHNGAGNDARNAFTILKELFRSMNFPVSSLVRQWNYVEDILGFDDQRQRYQEFNNARGEFYGKWFEKLGYPAATGIGMNRGGVIIEFVAVKSKQARSLSVDNPQQVAAHTYSKKVLVGEESCLKSTPKFERARFFELLDKKMIFISGTASILGEKTVGIGNPEEQTVVTIRNIQSLYSGEVLDKLAPAPLQPKYGHARVYIKNREHFPAIRRTFRRHYGNLPVVYLIADICRDDLLVEIEGKVILE